MRDLSRLKAAAQADLDRPTPIVRWTARAKKLAKFVTAVTGVLTAIGALLGAVRGYFARSIGPAEMPKTGVASTAMDRVEEPKKQQPK